MYFISHTVAAATIAAWNFFSVFVEYYLLCKVYEEFPVLADKTTSAALAGSGVAECSAFIQQPDADKSNSVDNQGNYWMLRLVTWMDGFKAFTLLADEGGCCCPCDSFRKLATSWRIYMCHDVRNAGLGLSCLYMTVLGFGSITIAFAYSQGVSESVLGIIGGLGAAMGLLPSLVFPLLVKCLGVERTGLCGFALEAICLTMCVASVWSAGSPFDPQSLWTSAANLGDGFVGDSLPGANATTVQPAVGVEAVAAAPNVSVILLLTGIVTARLGLWVADLSVNQVLQGVGDDIRGSINGVQHSMNMICDTIKLLLVISLPKPATFGYLVVASFAAICTGFVFFATYAFRKLRPF